jgi:hypothetical protein
MSTYEQQKREMAARKALYDDTARFNAIRKLAARRWATLDESAISSSTVAHSAAERCWRAAEELYDVIESNQPVLEDYGTTFDQLEQDAPAAIPTAAPPDDYDRGSDSDVLSLLSQLNDDDGGPRDFYFVSPDERAEGVYWAVVTLRGLQTDEDVWENPVATGRTMHEAVLNAMTKLGIDPCTSVAAAE